MIRLMGASFGEIQTKDVTRGYENPFRTGPLSMDLTTGIPVHLDSNAQGTVPGMYGIAYEPVHEYGREERQVEKNIHPIRGHMGLDIGILQGHGLGEACEKKIADESCNTKYTVKYFDYIKMLRDNGRSFKQSIEFRDLNKKNKLGYLQTNPPILGSQMADEPKIVKERIIPRFVRESASKELKVKEVPSSRVISSLNIQKEKLLSVKGMDSKVSSYISSLEHGTSSRSNTAGMDAEGVGDKTELSDGILSSIKSSIASLKIDLASLEDAHKSIEKGLVREEDFGNILQKLANIEASLETLERRYALALSELQVLAADKRAGTGSGIRSEDLGNNGISDSASKGSSRTSDIFVTQQKGSLEYFNPTPGPGSARPVSLSILSPKPFSPGEKSFRPLGSQYGLRRGGPIIDMNESDDGTAAREVDVRSTDIRSLTIVSNGTGGGPGVEPEPRYRTVLVVNKPLERDLGPFLGKSGARTSIGSASRVSVGQCKDEDEDVEDDANIGEVGGPSKHPDSLRSQVKVGDPISDVGGTSGDASPLKYVLPVDPQCLGTLGIGLGVGGSPTEHRSRVETLKLNKPLWSIYRSGETEEKTPTVPRAAEGPEYWRGGEGNDDSDDEDMEILYNRIMESLRLWKLEMSLAEREEKRKFLEDKKKNSESRSRTEKEKCVRQACEAVKNKFLREREERMLEKERERLLSGPSPLPDFSLLDVKLRKSTPLGGRHRIYTPEDQVRQKVEEELEESRRQRLLREEEKRERESSAALRRMKALVESEKRTKDKFRCERLERKLRGLRSAVDSINCVALPGRMVISNGNYQRASSPDEFLPPFPSPPASPPSD
ncbi:hypothetical protein HWI79_1535 [Cryptosporidium felis]|nr:hypothetical protein HWI79_1535 [Cryptosporidium felis]